MDSVPNSDHELYIGVIGIVNITFSIFIPPFIPSFTLSWGFIFFMGVFNLLTSIHMMEKNYKKNKAMTAKEAREYAKKQLEVVQGNNKSIFDDILQQIHDAIDSDPTKTFAMVNVPPKQVIAWLESKAYGYETAILQAGPNETSLKVSWSEDGIKQYGNGR